VPISRVTVTEKGKLLERAGRKITSLQPQGHGRGISEVSRSFGELGELNGEAGSVARNRQMRERLPGNRKYSELP
jgi:hypothetical protein